MSVENNNRKITQLPKITTSAMTDDDIFVFVHSGTTSQGTLGDIKTYTTGNIVDTFSTGGTYSSSASTITINDNQGGNFNITGITTNIDGTNGITIQSGDTIELGGALTKFTSIDGNNQTLFLGSTSSRLGTYITWADFASVTVGDTADESATWTLTPSNAGLITGLSGETQIGSNDATLGQSTKLIINHGDAVFEDTVPNSAGIQYAANYISGFTKESLSSVRYVDINENNYWFVDSINGNDGDVEQGNRRKAYKTIAAAESGATTGDVIKIIADIQECGLGKDGLTYIFEEGVKLYFPSSEATPGDLNTAHLWSDYRAGTAISFVVYGGYHEAEGNWFGPSDRGIIRNNFGSDIKIYDAEKIFAKGTSQDLIVAQGTGGNTEMHCKGDIISGLNGLQLTGAIDSNVVVKAEGKIQTELRKIACYSGAEGNKVLFEAGTEIVSLGHSISGLRSTLYGNTGNPANPEHWILKAPRITYYDPYPNLGSNNGAFLFGWNNYNLKLDVVAEILTMSNIDPETYTNEAGLLALNYGGGNSNYDVRLDVRTIVLGKGHEFDDTSYTPGRTKALVKIKDCEIVTMSDLLHSGNVIDTNYFIPSFEGACKLIINPDAITAGQKAIGSSGGNDGWVMGHVITNGDYYDVNFTDKFSGLIGGAITNIKVNDTSEITDFTKYNNIL